MKFKRSAIIFFYLSFAFLTVNAQASDISPLSSALINTKHILFSFPQSKDAVKYQLFYKIYNRMVKDTVSAALLIDKPGIILKKVFNFGDKVWWRYTGLDKSGKVIFTSDEYNFSIARLPEDIRQYYRFKVVVPKAGNEVVFMDNPGLAIDRTGDPVWFLPEMQKARIMDLRLNPDGNISYIAVGGAKGRALVNDLFLTDTLFNPHNSKHPMIKYLTFHHHFERLKDNSYLLIADVRSSPDSREINTATVNNFRFPQVVLNMTVNGEVKWIWEADKFLTLDETECYGHINSAGYNIDKQELVISMKDLSRIILVNPVKDKVIGWNSGHYSLESRKLSAKRDSRGNKIPVQKVESHSGLTPLVHQKTDKPLRPERDRFPENTGPFSGQHSIQFNHKGEILMFNNNANNPDNRYSSLLIIDRPEGNGVKTKTVWEHSLVFNDSLPQKSSARGGVQEVAPYRYFTYMGSVSRMFESDSARNILWLALAEYKDDVAPSWSMISGYKANMASSIYPAAFVAEKWNQGSTDVKLKISNLGSENDTYTIRTQSGKLITRLDVNAETSKPLVLKKYANEILRVESGLNPAHFYLLD